jgi:hypothetical protein
MFDLDVRNMFHAPCSKRFLNAQFIEIYGSNETVILTTNKFHALYLKRQPSEEERTQDEIFRRCYVRLIL